MKEVKFRKKIKIVLINENTKLLGGVSVWVGNVCLCVCLSVFATFLGFYSHLQRLTVQLTNYNNKKREKWRVVSDLAILAQ